MRKFTVAALGLLLALPAFAEVWEARYGVAETFNFKLYNADGTLDIDEVDGGTEVSLSCNEGAETTATNDFNDEGTFYSIALTATEMQCERVAVVVAATTTEVFFIQTVNHASAMNPNFIQSGDGFARLGTPAGASIAADIATVDDFVDTEVAAILDDTGTNGVALANGAITAAKFGAGAIDSSAIATDAIGAAELAADAIGASELATDAIGAAELAANAIAAAEIASAAIDADAIATDAIGAAELAADAIGAAEVAAATIDAATFAAGAIDAAAVATDAIGAAEIAADALTTAEIATGAISADEVADDAIDAGALAAGAIAEDAFATTAGSFDALGIVDQGTAQSATGTTLVLRAAAAFADDEIIGSNIVITGGSAGVGQVRTITDYVSATDTATVATWTTTPTGTITYEILAAPSGAGGTVSIAAGGITASSFASGAIDASAIATDAIGAAELAASAIGADEIATGAIGATEIADAAIDSATYATTAGSFYPLQVIDQGTAQSATATTLVLRSAVAFADDELIGATITITGGSTGVGQSRIISDYVSATDTATVPNWTTTPSGTITYKVTHTAPGTGGEVSIAAGGITASSFAAGAIDASAIATDAVGAAEVAADAIGASELATDAIGATEIAADAIGASEIASAAIAADEIATSAIGAAELAADAIGAAEIADGAIDEGTFATTAGSFEPLGVIDQGTAQSATSTTLVLRSAAAFADDEIVGATILVTGGSAGVGQSRAITDYVSSTDTATVSAWTTTPTGTITYEIFGTAPGSLSAVSIAAGGITASSFATDAITAGVIAADAIGASELATDAIGATEIAASAIGASELADGGITSAEFASGAITATVLATDAIGAAELAADAIGASEIATDAIGAAELAAAAIAADEIATDAIGASELAASALGASEIADGALGEAEFATTAGSFDAFGIIDQGTAQSATATTLQLRSAAAFADDELNGTQLLITSGTGGTGQVREITDYDSASDTATVATWTTTPSGTITYQVRASVAEAAGSGGGLDAAGVRAAVGLATANLDTQLAGIESGVDIDTIEGLDATDQLDASAATDVTIAAGAISAATFAAGAIDAAAIAADAIGASELAANAIGASELATDAIGAAEIAADAITAAEVADSTIDANTFAAGAITAASIATDAITATEVAADAIGASEIAADAIAASELAAGAVTEVQAGLSTLDAAGVRSAVGLATANLDTQLAAIDDFVDTEIASILTATVVASVQAADSGTTTTVVDAARTEATTDYWKGSGLLIISGSLAGQLRCVTGFNPSTDTLTVKPAFTAAVSTHNYVLVRDALCTGVAP